MENFTYSLFRICTLSVKYNNNNYLLCYISDDVIIKFNKNILTLQLISDIKKKKKNSMLSVNFNAIFIHGSVDGCP